MSTDWQRDAELLERWRGGEGEAGEALFERHAHAVIRFFRNKTGVATEELVQQTFVRLLEGRDRIRDGVALRAFLLGVARNVLREHLRQLARDRSVDPEVDSMAALSPGPSTIVGRRREHRLLLEGLRRLPVEHQLALELFYWEGLKANEIAELVGISHSAMRSRLVRARTLLAERIAELGESAALVASTVGDLDEWAGQLRNQLAGEDPSASESSGDTVLPP